MKKASRPGVLLVATRELRWMRRDPLALFLVIGVPVIAFALLALTFSNAVIRNLHVAIVDADRTPTSMTYVQAIGSAPGVKVAERSDDLDGAMHAVRSGQAIAAVFIPPDFERDLLARKRPQIVSFYNRQYFTPGNSASSAISNAINAASAFVAPPRSAGFAPGVLAVEQYVLTNPALNYAQFLLRSVLPMVLHVVVAIAAGYAVGSEFSRRSLKTWLKTAGGSPLAALVGKLAPLFAIFIVMMAIVAVIIHGLYDIPFRGDPVIMGAAACLLVVAYLSVGALFQLLARNMAFGLSLTAIVCSPAFGFIGVGFPILGMNEFARVWGAVLPLRWYMQILFDQAVRGLPSSISAAPFGILGALSLLYFGLAWFGLRAVAGAHRARASTQQAALLSYSRPSIGGTMAAEFGRVLADRNAFSLIVLGPILYGLFYPQPYLGQVLRAIPIAVVDQDQTELSRNLVQTLNADEAIKVAVRSDTLSDAHSALGRREVFGIVGIPEGTEREVLKGNRARLPAYINSAYFLLYNRTLQGITEAASSVTADVAARGARADGSLAHAALIKSSPVELLTEPLFNPTGSYASYVVPAAFVLILQQTLLMGSALLGGVTFEATGHLARRWRGAPQAIAGQALAHVCLAMPGVALYLVILPRFFGFSTLGRPLDLFLMAVPFLLSVSLLAQFVGAWFTRRESAVLLFIATSLPLFFLVGVSWPLEAIPNALRAASAVFPSTSAIDGLVRVNQMGATLNDVWGDWITLWALTGIYGVLAVLAASLTAREGSPMASKLPRFLLWGLPFIALAGVGLLVYRSHDAGPAAVRIPGVVRETEIHIAPEINGRLASVLVKAGQEVHEGEVLATLSNPELAASVADAKAALAKARADRDNVFAGVRKEAVGRSAREVEIAEANRILALQQYERSAALAAKDFASKQRLDENTASRRRSEANLALLREAHARNRAGPTREERASAEAKVALAEAAVANLEAKLEKTKLVAPVDSVVRLLVAQPGEVISPGQSVLTLQAGRERWFTFTIREDRLGSIRIGSPVKLLTAKGSPIEGRVTELRPLGEFATWRAARAAGDHDLNSFLVRIDPSESNEDLQPGMTVWLEPDSMSAERS